MLALEFGKPSKHFSGNWGDRLEGLFDLGVDFGGKSILDAGCNMGIIAYEISKQNPSFIHGIDNYKPHVTIARWIFKAVDVPSEFVCLNLSKIKKLKRVLRPNYDVVLFLAVYHHIARKFGLTAADAVTEILAECCAGKMLASAGPKMGNDLRAVLERLGFRVTRELSGTMLFEREQN